MAAIAPSGVMRSRYARLRNDEIVVGRGPLLGGPGRRSTIGPSRSDPLLFELHVQPEAADLVGQDVEARGGAGFEGVLPLDHRLVDLGPPLDVVALDGQQLLED